MPEPTVGEIMDALGDQIRDVLCGTADPLIEQLQVVPDMFFNPTPPSIDVYPAEDFTTGLGMGLGNVEFSFVVRVRVSTADDDGGRGLLKSMIDPRSETSVAMAILSDKTLGGLVDDMAVVGQSGYGGFPSFSGEGSLLGCTWTVRVLP